MNDFLHSDLFGVIQLVAAVLVVAVIVKLFFSQGSGGKAVTDLDPLLAQTARRLLLEHLESMKKGKLVSEKNISAELLPALKQKMSEFQQIIAGGVVVESEVKDLDQCRITATEKSDGTIKVKICGHFRQEYFHNGKLIENPGDPESYVSGGGGGAFDDNCYVLNFRKAGNSDYQLIGITDNVMGNSYGIL